MGKARQIVAQLVPVAILRPIFTWRSKRRASQYRRSGSNEVFTEIYKTNHWGSSESASGVGSEAASTRNISEAIPRLIKELHIRSIFDAPCGDFQWMQRVDLAGVDYTGADIVAPLIEAVSAKYAGENRKFVRFDLVSQVPPAVDLIICRDCFIHLPFEMILKALENFRGSGAKYLLATTYQNWPFNYDTSVGGVRAVDLCKWPFNLPEPMELIREEPSTATGEQIRCMGLWSIASLAK